MFSCLRGNELYNNRECPVNVFRQNERANERKRKKIDPTEYDIRPSHAFFDRATLTKWEKWEKIS